MQNKIGVESAYGFGDCLFNVPLLEAIKAKYDLPLTVAVQKQCEDAFYNLKCVDEIITITRLDEGYHRFRLDNYRHFFQITQNVLFLHYRNIDHNHSLIDTPAWYGKDNGFILARQKPIFHPTHNELSKAHAFINALDKPTIAIEAVAKSGQSWMDQIAVDMIINAHINTHNILWMSNSRCPQHDDIIDMSDYSRRELIMILRGCSKFYTTGSGFFCASLALAGEDQPDKIIVLWIDEFYKYEARLKELEFHKQIVWVHNHHELLPHL